MNIPSLWKNPITTWARWYINTVKIIIINKDKYLKIGYMSIIHNVQFGIYNTIYNHVNISNTQINDYVYISNYTIITNTVIGKFCSIGQNVKIGLPMHPTTYISTFPAFFSKRKQCQITFTKENLFEEKGSVKIGNDVWIGENAIVMNNIIIGDGAIVGAGAVVTKDVEPYSIVGGVPAKLIRYRFSKAEIEKLLTTKWWDNDLTWFENNFSVFSNAPSFFKSM